MADTTDRPARSRLLRHGVTRAMRAANVLWPVRRNPVLTIPSFVDSLVVGEAAPLVLGVWGVRSAVEVRRARRNGGLTVRDLAGLGLTAAAATALAASIRTAMGSAEDLRAAVSTLVPEHELDARPRAPKWGAVWPLATGRNRRRKTRGLVYADVGTHRLKLDVYEPARPAEPGELRPAIVQVHGGAWIVGSKDEQGIPLLNHLAGQGWVGFNVEYRLSPNAKFPTHLQDCKRAVAWVREHAGDYGVDPDFIAVTGGSAGGHLAALMALTENDPAFQPGFEDADTSLQAAVPFYGVYDLLDREKEQVDTYLRFLEQLVMGSHPDADPVGWASYSPIDRIDGDAPPTMLLHGSSDVLVPVTGARQFAAKLSDASSNPVVYAELDGAQHGFDLFASIRSTNAAEYVERFLHHVHAQYLCEQPGPARETPEGEPAATGAGATAAPAATNGS